MNKRANGYVGNVLEDDIQVLSRLDESFIFDDIGMLDSISYEVARVQKEGTVR